MKFQSTVVAALSAALAVEAGTVASGTTGPHGDLGRRDHEVHTNFAKKVSSQGAQKDARSTPTIQYTSNWSGAVVDGNEITYARGTFSVPVPQPAPGTDPNAYSSAAIWVGIDGNSCSEGLLQAGVALRLNQDYAGEGPSYVAWYAWFPDTALVPVDLEVNPGDSIRVSIYAYTPTSGMIMIENLTQNTHVSQNFSNMTNTLCFGSAEWIVEDLGIGDGLAPFSNYTTEVFTDCYQAQGGLQNAYIVDMQQDSGIVSTCSLNTGVSSVTCSYV